MATIRATSVTRVITMTHVTLIGIDSIATEITPAPNLPIASCYWLPLV